MIIANAVLLLKSQTKDSEEKYSLLLKENNFKVEQATTIVFEFKNLQILKEKLENNNLYDGLIFSSSRCVEAVYLAVKNNSELISKWKEKQNYVVGESTYRSALNQLGLDCKGKETGNADNLSRYILHDKQLFSKGFLFPHGNLKTDTLNRELAKEGINLENVLVYDTISNPELESELALITNNFQDVPEFVVLFSPSGLNSSIEYLNKIPDFSRAKLVAIGPVTELAIKQKGLTVFGVAKNPNAEEILKMILNKE